MSHPTGRSWPPLCSTSSGLFSCTPLASESCMLVYPAALNPIACSQSNFAPSFRSTWHPTSSCACQSFARSSCLVSLLCNAIYRIDLSLRPTSQSSREKASLRFLHRSIITLFLPTSRPLLSTSVSRPSQLCHTLFQLPTATHSNTQATNTVIDSPFFFTSNSIFVQDIASISYPRCKFATPSSCALRESRAW